MLDYLKLVGTSLVWGRRQIELHPFFRSLSLPSSFSSTLFLSQDQPATDGIDVPRWPTKNYQLSSKFPEGIKEKQKWWVYLRLGVGERSWRCRTSPINSHWYANTISYTSKFNIRPQPLPQKVMSQSHNGFNDPCGRVSARRTAEVTERSRLQTDIWRQFQLCKNWITRFFSFLYFTFRFVLCFPSLFELVTFRIKL